MGAPARRSLSASRPRRRHELWALATVVILTLAVAPAVLAAGGDHGACGADWVKFEFSNSGAIGPAIWSSPAPATPAPTLSVTQWKEGTEAVQIAWSHADTDEPVWTVAQVWLKAGSDQQADGGLFGPYPGGESGLAPADGSLQKGISFAVFCFDAEPSDPPTDPPTDDPTDPPTDDPTDPPTDDPTEPTETGTPTEPTEADTEDVLPDEVETTDPEPTESEGVDPDPEAEEPEPDAETPTTAPVEQEQEQVEVLADSLPATGAGTWLLLVAGLLSLAAGTALVRRTA